MIMGKGIHETTEMMLFFWVKEMYFLIWCVCSNIIFINVYIYIYALY